MTDTLQHDDRGAQLKKLSRKMVHSLNNMIFIIDAYKDLIKENPTDPEFLTHIARIDAAIDQTQKILRDWRVDADKIVPDPENEHL